MHVLVTGGAGYIGAHTVVELLTQGHEVVILDNLSNSCEGVLPRIARICRRAPAFVQMDVRDTPALTRLLTDSKVDAVIHFAGLKAVGESVSQPLAYYDNNVAGSISLLNAMQQSGVFSLVFSSSATVYGPEAAVPYREEMPLGSASNPYGSSKIMIEKILLDLCHAQPCWSVAALRYFNPIGAHPSGLIGESPLGVPGNLLPFITQVAAGKREALAIFGDDYDTIDGTCVRDYLHVVDLARGHSAALQGLAARCPARQLSQHLQTPGAGFRAWNLGTGKGTSVLQIVRGFEAVTGVKVPWRIAPRRAGDLPAFWADASRARAELGWQADLDLNSMLGDAWRWQSRNPLGYTD